MHNPRKKIVLLALALFLTAGAVHAQSDGIVPDPVQYSATPETPGPNTTVSLSVQGVGTFLGDSTVTWSQNGTVLSSGVGDSSYSFTTGALGQETDIHVEIDSSAEGTITHDFIFIPSLVDLIWEADTSAPPFFRGKPLYSAGSELTVIAYPIVILNGTRIAADSLSFQWTVDDIPQTAQSGLGKNTISFMGNQLQNGEDVEVDVDLGNALVGESEIVVSASSPQVVLYEQDPLRGTLYDEALPSSISLDTKELTVQAVPYYFSNESIENGSLSYNWTLNGAAITGPESAQGILTLLQTGSGTGAADLAVSVQNNDSSKFVQAANATLQLVFGASTGSSISSLFGL
jgi:hypothetical protein